MNRVGIVGSGSWGTALSVLIAQTAPEVLLWGREPDLIHAIDSAHENPRYLPGIPLPEKVRATTDFAALAQVDALFVVVPSKAIRQVAGQIAGLGLPSHVPVVSCAKGIENATGLRMSQILAEILPAHPVAVLSGPNHAEEVARRLPAAAVVGCVDPTVSRHLQDLIVCPWFRAYPSEDVCGMEWGGAAKNIFAIAAGIAEGLKLGDNAKAALLTRGLAEMIRLGLAMGGRPETFQGLSGVGDLIVTCFSHHSRNHRVGQALGRGEKLAEIVERLGMVAEGVPNTESIHHASQRAGVRTPIIDTMYAVLYEGLPCHEALRSLLERDPRPEVE